MCVGLVLNVIEQLILFFIVNGIHIRKQSQEETNNLRKGRGRCQHQGHKVLDMLKLKDLFVFV